MEKEAGKTEFRPVIITGPESTGKTSIARFLAESCNGVYIPEFARDYIEQLGRSYNYSDIVNIAQKQLQQYTEACSMLPAEPVFLDTFLIITKIWMQWNSGQYENWMDDALRSTKHALYLLCAPDLDWEADNVRENGGEKRIKLFNLYKQELINFKLNYILIEGIGAVRHENAQKAVNKFLKNK